MLPGFIELPIWNPPYNEAYRLAPGKTPTHRDHNDYGQGTVLIRVNSISCITPIWEGEGDIWSHSDIALLSGGSVSVDASFEQIEEKCEQTTAPAAIAQEVA